MGKIGLKEARVAKTVGVSVVSCDGLGEVARLPTGQGAVLWVLGVQIQLIAADRDHLRK